MMVIEEIETTEPLEVVHELRRGAGNQLGLFDPFDQVTPEQIKKAMESQMAEDDQKLYEATVATFRFFCDTDGFLRGSNWIRKRKIWISQPCLYLSIADLRLLVFGCLNAAAK